MHRGNGFTTWIISSLKAGILCLLKDKPPKVTDSPVCPAGPQSVPQYSPKYRWSSFWPADTSLQEQRNPGVQVNSLRCLSGSGQGSQQSCRRQRSPDLLPPAQSYSLPTSLSFLPLPHL